MYIYIFIYIYIYLFMLCGLQEDMNRNHLQRCAALSGTKESERYWEARSKMSTVL